MNLSLDVALGSMSFLAQLGRSGHLDGLGLSRADFDRFIGSDPWLASDRNRMSAILHTMANSSLDAQGLPRFSLPAEYLAAVIAVFVHPVNVHASCVFAPPSMSAQDAGRAGGVTAENCTSEQLFALVVQLFSNSARGNARVLFEKKTGLALEKVSHTATESGDSSNRKKMI